MTHEHDVVYALHFDVPHSLAAAARVLVLRLAALGFEERSLKSGFRFVLYPNTERERLKLQAELEAACHAEAQLRGKARLTTVDIRVNWRDAWTEGLGREALTATSWVVPVALDCDLGGAAQTAAVVPECDPNAHALEIQLARAGAFGFGEHPSTRLAATELERLCLGLPGCSVLDLGTGTGVLAILAARRGAGQVLGLDIDRTSVLIAARNAALNGVSARCVFATEPVQEVGQRFDIVVANVEAPLLLRLATSLAERLAHPGSLVISGFMLDRRAEICQRLSNAGLTLSSQAEVGGWCSAVFVSA